MRPGCDRVAELDRGRTHIAGFTANPVTAPRSAPGPHARGALRAAGKLVPPQDERAAVTPQKPRRRHAAPGPTRWTDPRKQPLGRRLLNALKWLLDDRDDTLTEGLGDYHPDRLGAGVGGLTGYTPDGPTGYRSISQHSPYGPADFRSIPQWPLRSSESARLDPDSYAWSYGHLVPRQRGVKGC